MKQPYKLPFDFAASFILIVLLHNIVLGQTVRLKSIEGFVQTKDYVKLHYQILGEGKDTIVVVPGGNTFGAAYLVPDLTPLAAHHTLLFFDPAGAGYSTVVKDTARYNMKRVVDDIESIRKHFHLKKLNLLGHSTSGLIVGYYAITNPTRLNSMILMSPMPAAAYQMKDFNSDKKHDSTSLLLLRQNGKIYRNAPVDTMKACWDYYSLWARGFVPSYAEARKMWGNICNCDQANLMSPYSYNVFRSLGNWDITAQLANVKTRSLIIVGDKDAISFDSFQLWDTSLPNSVLINFKGAGHMPHVDYPIAFASAIQTFMQNKWPDESVLQLNGAGVVLDSDMKGSAYLKARVSIIRTENNLVRLINKAAWDSVASVYLPDGIIYPPGAPPVLGQKAIGTFWRTVASRGMKEIDLKLIDLEYSGDLLIAKGKYVMTDKEKAILDIGKFIAIYRKEKNLWRLQTDIFNSSMETRSPIEIPDYLTLGKN
jgi:pimeloyl-ACP methyl ester carboxylesterase/ketosteroid isomerase-like protein